MTVKELIEKLQQYPEYAMVQIWWPEDENDMYKANAEGEIVYNKKKNSVTIS